MTDEEQKAEIFRLTSALEEIAADGCENDPPCREMDVPVPWCNVCIAVETLEEKKGSCPQCHMVGQHKMSCSYKS